MNIDLNIENYNFHDLLELFNLNHNFGENELKKCYKTVLQTHPDKSGLDPNYFLFYTKAFKILKNVFNYKNKKNTSLDEKNAKIEYLAMSEEDAGKQLLVEQLQKKKAGDFNKWFNDTFEKLNLNNNLGGYGDWLESDDGINDEKINSINQLHDKINRKKENLSALVKRGEIDELATIGDTNNLDTDLPEYYSSGVFSKLQYDDLKKAHTESVIPVCDNDYNNVQKFKNISSLRDYRNSQNLKPMSKTEAREKLDNNHDLLDRQNTELAYKLTKQAEESERKNQVLWNTIRSIK